MARNNRTTVLIALAAASLAISAPAMAQPEPAAGRRGGAVHQVVNLSFPGGSLQEYVRAINSDANILVSGEAGAITLPAITLKQVDVVTALQTLETLVHGTHGVKLDTVPSSSSNSKPVYVVQVRRMSRGAVGPTGVVGAEPSIEVFSLRALADAEKADPSTHVLSLLTAIETAVELNPQATEPPVIRYHPETSLLIVRAVPSQLTVVDRLVKEVFNDVVATQREQENIQDQLMDMEASRHMGRIRLEGLMAKVERTQAKLDWTQQLVDAANVPASELAAVRAEYTQVRTELQMGEAELQSIENRIARLRDRASRNEAAANAPASLNTTQAVRRRIKSLEDELSILRNKLAMMERADQ